MERSLEGEQQQQLDIPELDLRAIPECALVKRPDAGWLLAPMGTRAARSGSPSNLPNHAICWQCGARGRCGSGSRGKAMRGSPALYVSPWRPWRGGASLLDKQRAVFAWSPVGTAPTASLSVTTWQWAAFPSFSPRFRAALRPGFGRRQAPLEGAMCSSSASPSWLET